jgi:hypothetical protein
MARSKGRRGRGEGAIYQLADGRWAAAVDVGRNPKTGKRRRKVIKRKTKKEVQDRLDELRQQRRDRQQVAEEMRLRLFLDFWLDGTVKPKVDPETYRVYKQRINDYILPHLGQAPVAGLTVFMVKQWYEDLEKAGSSADLRNKVGQILRRALHYAVRRGYARENVAAEMALPQAEVKEMRPLSRASRYSGYSR